MKQLQKVVFNLAKFRSELADFKILLDKKDELSEAADILPFFKNNLQLSAFLASFNGAIMRPDAVAHEYPLFGDLRTDVIVADTTRHAYAFVEFEDAKKESMFVSTGRYLTEWSSRFEHGFGQIVDWLWKVADMFQTSDFEAKFGSRSATFVGLLVIGRSKFLSPQDKNRLEWRRSKLLVDSRLVFCCTYDELYEILRGNLELIESP